MAQDGRGWHGDTPRHRDAALKAQAGRACNTPMKKEEKKEEGNTYNRNYKTMYANRTKCGSGTYSDIEQFLMSGMSLEEISTHVNIRIRDVRKVVQDILEQQKNKKGIITLPF